MAGETTTAQVATEMSSDPVSSAFLAGLTGNSIPAPVAAAPVAPAAQQPAAPASVAQTPDPAVQQQAPAAPATPAVQTPAPAAQQPAGQTQAAAAPTEVDLGFGKIVVNSTPAPVPTTYEDLFKLDPVKNALGINGDITPETLYNTVVPAITETRKKAAEHGQMKSTLDSFTETIKNMPPQLAQAVTSYIANPSTNDWMANLSANEVTLYAKPVDQIPAADLVKNMIGTELTPEQIADPSDAQAQQLINKSRELYNEKQQQKKLLVDTQVRDAQKRRDAFSASISLSAQSVAQHLPVQVDPAQVTAATTLLAQGANGIMSLFIDENGAYRPDAVANIILVREGNGQKMIETLKKTLLPQVQSVVNEEIVGRGIATNTGGASAGEAKKISPEQARNVNALTAFGFLT
jgi:hypothetical protein